MSINHLEIAQNMLSGCLFIPQDYLKADTQIIAIPGFDSISFETLLAQIEDFIGEDIEYQPIIEIKTVQDLANFLEKYHDK